jgi:hypothetical protein
MAKPKPGAAIFAGGILFGLLKRFKYPRGLKPIGRDTYTAILHAKLQFYLIAVFLQYRIPLVYRAPIGKLDSIA